MCLVQVCLLEGQGEGYYQNYVDQCVFYQIIEFYQVQVVINNGKEQYVVEGVEGVDLVQMGKGSVDKYCCNGVYQIRLFGQWGKLLQVGGEDYFVDGVEC